MARKLRLVKILKQDQNKEESEQMIKDMKKFDDYDKDYKEFQGRRAMKLKLKFTKRQKEEQTQHTTSVKPEKRAVTEK